MVGFAFKFNEMFGATHKIQENTMGLENQVQKGCNRERESIRTTNNALQKSEIPLDSLSLENVYIGLGASLEENNSKYYNSSSVLDLTV